MTSDNEDVSLLVERIVKLHKELHGKNIDEESIIMDCIRELNGDYDNEYIIECIHYIVKEMSL